MELNMITTGIELIGTTIKSISVENSVVDVEREAKRSFGLNINEPTCEKIEEGFLSQMTIDIEVEIEQLEGQSCNIKISLEGAFVSEGEIGEDEFKQLVAVNGAAALIGIARGKIESISSNVFNNGKVVIPFVNVVDYYRSLVD